MSIEEIKRCADEITGTPCRVETTLEPGEVYIFTNVWTLTGHQLRQYCDKFSVTAISVDGYKLMISIKN